MHLQHQSLALFTDLYQLTMAHGYWKAGVHHQRAAFDLFFRKNPFKGGYAIAAGLAPVIDFLNGLSFERSDLDYLSTLRGNNDEPLFEEGFLAELEAFEFTCDVDAVPEGRVVFPHEPLMRIVGPVLQAQLIETPLLNLINFNTLIATKASRVCQSANGDPVLEFGLRRAQGMDGGLSVARSAYIGGVAATSNVLAGKVYGIPVKGTHAHSWVMFFDTERESFETYASALPNNCVFLVDTYDTTEGIAEAIRVGKKMRESGHEMIGIRLDSGDLAYLSNVAREMLDGAGFPDAQIVASNDLDEHIIASLKQQGASIGVWGVGTKLATAYDQPALGGVYKLSAIERDGEWIERIKISEQAIKVNNPGLHLVRRYHDGQTFVGDLIYDERKGVGESSAIVDLMDVTRRKPIDANWTSEELLKPVFAAGQLVYDAPTLEEIRAVAQSDLDKLHPSIRRFLNPHEYPVGLEPELHQLKTELMFKARGTKDVK